MARAEFKYIVDNAAFAVKPGESIPAKRVVPIDITFDASKSSQKTGKLVITCPSLSPAPWLYYLQAAE
eukprot:1170338-Prorocentrum_minimum.AAC.1